MRGVQFFTDNLGNKTAAIVDLKEHSDFWAEVLAECGEPIDFQFLVDSHIPHPQLSQEPSLAPSP